MLEVADTSEHNQGFGNRGNRRCRAAVEVQRLHRLRGLTSSGGRMDSDPASRASRKHTNGWMTVLALCLLAVGLLACLYVLVGFPAEAQVTGSTDSITTPVPQTVRRQPLYAVQTAAAQSPVVATP